MFTELADAMTPRNTLTQMKNDVWKARYAGMDAQRIWESKIDPNRPPTSSSVRADAYFCLLARAANCGVDDADHVTKAAALIVEALESPSLDTTVAAFLEPVLNELEAVLRASVDSIPHSPRPECPSFFRLPEGEKPE
jgi:hypothetical protein